MRDADQVLALLKKYIRHEMNEQADIVSTGGCPTWDIYQKLTGVIHGLALVERKLLDLAKEDDDDSVDPGESQSS
jgi:hypothetical protein